MHIGHFKQKIYIHWSTALRVTRLKVVARKFLSVKKWHLITAMELFRRFNWHQILYIDVGSSAHKSIPILRRPTHRKRVLNRRHQNFIYIGQCQPKLHIHWVCLSENSIHIAGPGLETSYTLAIRNENSIYIDPFLGHNEHVMGA